LVHAELEVASDFVGKLPLIHATGDNVCCDPCSRNTRTTSLDLRIQKDVSRGLPEAGESIRSVADGA